VGLAPLALGDALHDRYTLERELGRGGTAIVYLARDVRHSRFIALKVLRPEIASVVGTERFLREIQLTAKLQHPHILGLFDSGEAEGRLYYSMPYVAGESLRTRLTREPQLPLEEALSIAAEVARALAYAHGQGVIHRDIKPENILLESGPTGTRALVADFGIAQALAVAGGEPLTATGVAIGTPAYMSPEQAAGSARLDTRCDVYGLGCVVYEMLAGQPPFTGCTLQAVLAQHAAAPVPHVRAVRPAVPYAVEQAVTKALAKVPADRFATATAFAEALARRDAAPGIWRRLSWRRAGLVGGAALVTAAALLLVSPVSLGLRGRAPASLDNRSIVVAVEGAPGADPGLASFNDLAAHAITRQLIATGLPNRVLLAGADRRLEPAEAGKQAGARLVVSGGVSTVGDSVALRASLIDALTREELWSATPIVVARGAARAAAESFGDRVAAAAATRLDPELANWIAAASQPSSVRSYREFRIGFDRWFSGDWDAGGEHLRAAAALDTGFTLPVVILEVPYADDSSSLASLDSLAHALERRPLPPVDRAILDMALGNAREDPAASYEAAKRLAAAAPRSEWMFLLAWAALNVGRAHEAARICEQLHPNAGWIARCPEYWSIFVLSLHMVGDHSRAVAVAEEARQLFPTNRIVMQEYVIALAGAGRVAEIESAVDRAMALQDTPHWTRMQPATQAVIELRAYGHAEAARRITDRVIAWYREQPPDQRDSLASEYAGILYDDRRFAEARAAYASILRRHPSDEEAKDAIAEIAAEQGDGVTAKRFDAELARRRGPRGLSGVLVARARIAASLGDRDAAVRFLRDGFRAGFVWRHSLHWDPAFASLHGYAPFDELARPTD